jgi:DNA-binding response OmpR family regulator
MNMAASDHTACILLVEDNPADAMLIQHMLRRAAQQSYRVILASRIQDVERIVHEEHVDVVLLDLSLPDAFGIETVKLLRTITYDLPIIVQTGVDDEQLALACIDAGAQDYLLKNELRPIVLRRTIRYAIERHKLQMQLHELSLRDDLTNL